LAARGETTHGILTNLFKGYQAINDKVFISYIGRKLEKYEEGTTITSEAIMQLGDNKYKLLKKGGQWKAPSDKEARFWLFNRKSRNYKRTQKVFHVKPIKQPKQIKSRIKQRYEGLRNHLGSSKNLRKANS
jgi:hypothetical protein